ncbi:MAG: alginate export family protein [Pirellulales bacterium]|nr:alginate export family protein [Pirellulales bacterium]
MNGFNHVKRFASSVVSFCAIVCIGEIAAAQYEQDQTPVPLSPVPNPLDVQPGVGEGPALDGTAPSAKDVIDCCDPEKQAALKAAVGNAHKGLFYNNDFSYVNNPCFCDWQLGDCLKQRCIHNGIIMDAGGQYRFRYHNERNIRGTSLTGVDDEFGLHRLRYFVNLDVNPYLRIYGEGLSAVSQGEDFAPRAIEESKANLQNLFGDFLLYADCCGELTGRVGRQELLYGAQRSVSPLDWANTRRTFEGASLIWKGKNWDLDTFWTHPVSPAGDDFQSTNTSQEFGGTWATYKAVENETLDLYYLRFVENGGAGFEFNTFGGRYHGSAGSWLWDSWGAGQFGEVGSADQSGWAYTVGLGRKFECAPWKPTLWTYYDSASGDASGNGYHHQFPLAHKYLGYMDLFGRRNLNDLNVLLTLKPAEKTTLLLWWHDFEQEDANDGVYNVVMAQTAAANANGNRDLGQELDVILKHAITPRAAVLFGYSHFWTGGFFTTHQNVPFSGDADFYYVQIHQNF